MTTDSVRDLADGYWATLTREDPMYALKAGLPPESVGLLDQSAAQERSATARALLDRLDALETDEADADLAAVLRTGLATESGRATAMWHSHPTAPYQTYLHIGLVARGGIAPLAGAERDRLTGAFAARVRSVAEVLRGQRRRGIALPRPAVPGSIATWAALGDELHTLLGAEAVDAAAAEVRAEIDAAAATAPEEAGLAHLPGGEEAYRALVRQHTTQDVEPEALHRLGLEQCAELKERMAEIRVRLGGPGDEEEARSWAASQAHLYAADAEAVAATYRRHLARVEPGLKTLFRAVPGAGYDVRRLDASDESGMTFGYYQPPTSAEPTGLYRFNASNLAERSLLTSAALILHELVPGHHFHIASQAENAGLHPLQRHAMELGAFSEGWAEYASHLGWELGAYTDDWDAYGRLAHERFTAQRLVVDTALNLGYWDLERARAFMRANTLESDRQIASEVLRYATDLPAQALAYRSGFLAFRRVREAAGDRDPRTVHEAMLAGGAVPLPRMRQRVGEAPAVPRGRLS